MLDLKDLECLLALTRFKHFAKAAQHCGVSQPAFSMRIRNLEERLDTQIVKRGNRYIGLTSDGEMVVQHARAIVDQARALQEEVKAARGEISGSLVLGVVPTASAYAGHVVEKLHKNHPGIRVRIQAASSLAIQQGIEHGRFDAGFTYTEGASPDLLRIEPVYNETYVLMVPREMTDQTLRISWLEAAELPLILLEPEMLNRRIIDKVMEEVGAHPRVLAETNGFIPGMVMASKGVGATIVPSVLSESLGPIGATRFLKLDTPLVEKELSLVTPQRPHRIPAVEALRRTVLDETQ